ncbi:MAG: hypothetical protein GFH25_541276n41 [Chloroflexi bacterium AL-N10]|nr:hypothetical protein [Chloroflexi bacterium AL-N1]NOK71122.1 hypothetical protein [Chloroflexi bacterium AL-N10]NOK77370.1 hypothetical protein [Chloroflexi bacterium AL-N5]
MIPAISIKAALDGFESLGLNTSDVLNAIGINPELFRDPFAVVPNNLFGQLWIHAFSQTSDPTLPTALVLQSHIMLLVSSIIWSGVQQP